MKKILLIANLDKSDSQIFLKEIQTYLDQKQISYEVFCYQGMAAVPKVAHADLAVVLGGDGTALFSARILMGTGTPILGVNLGTVGFITEVVRDEWKEVFEKYARGDLTASPRLMIQAEIFRGGKRLARIPALNDVVVSASGSSKIIHFTVDLSGIFLGDYRADGMIVATPTGSTAYSLAAGGPILHPETEAMILTPICPHSLSNRPIVLPPAERISIKLKQNQRTDISITVDGRDVFPLLPGDEVQVRRLREKTFIVRSDKRSFYEVVRAKLN